MGTVLGANGEHDTRMRSSSREDNQPHGTGIVSKDRAHHTLTMSYKSCSSLTGCEAEVGYLSNNIPLLPKQQDVFRLNIAMHNRTPVHVLQRPGDVGYTPESDKRGSDRMHTMRETRYPTW